MDPTPCNSGMTGTYEDFTIVTTIPYSDCCRVDRFAVCLGFRVLGFRG